MTPQAQNRFKNARFLRRRAFEESVQAAIVQEINRNWRALGIPHPRLFFSLATWLGKPSRVSSFYVVKRLSDLGMVQGAPRLGLFVPRGRMLGLFLWIAPLDIRDSPEEAAMKRALGTQGYEVVTVRDAAGGVRVITDYLAMIPSAPNSVPCARAERVVALEPALGAT